MSPERGLLYWLEVESCKPSPYFQSPPREHIGISREAMAQRVLERKAEEMGKLSAEAAAILKGIAARKAAMRTKGVTRESLQS